MIPILTLTEILIPLLFTALFLLFFLPALFELKRPKDAGPRMIKNMELSLKSNNVKADLSFLINLENIEKREFMKTGSKQMTSPTRNPIFVLLNIEV